MSSALRERLKTRMVLQGLAAKTQEAYLRAVVSLVRFHGRSPEELTSEQIQSFLCDLIQNRGHAWSTVNVYFSGLRYFYRGILGWEQIRFSIPPRGRSRRRPLVLSRAEVGQLVRACRTSKQRAFLLTSYGAGLRVGEVVRLRPSHIESSPDRMMIRVEQGKGRKDRYTVLFDWVLEALRAYWREFRPSDWLFPGLDPRRPMPIGSAQQIYYRARDRAGITHGRGIHTLRHCFASHLVEAGTDIYTVKRLLGHSSISTTLGYLHVNTVRERPLLSPLGAGTGA